MNIEDEIVRVRQEGIFNIVKYIDEDYPGVDVEFIPNKAYDGTYPRVLFEFTKSGKLRVCIWGDRNEEDYSHCFEFDV